MIFLSTIDCMYSLLSHKIIFPRGLFKSEPSGCSERWEGAYVAMNLLILERLGLTPSATLYSENPCWGTLLPLTAVWGLQFNCRDICRRQSVAILSSSENITTVCSRWWYLRSAHGQYRVCNIQCPSSAGSPGAQLIRHPIWILVLVGRLAYWPGKVSWDDKWFGESTGQIWL